MTIEQRLQALDSAELSDAMDSLQIEAALLNIKPVLQGKKIAAKAFTVKYAPYDEAPTQFKSAGNYIDHVPAGSIVIVDNDGRTDCTVWGDILTTYSLNKGIVGTVIHGAVRDVAAIKQLDYPVFAKSVFMRSGKNRVRKIAQQIDIEIEGVRISNGDYVFADDNGVLAIPQNKIEDVLNRAETIKANEEKIIAAVQQGQSLESARKQYRYDQPWMKTAS